MRKLFSKVKGFTAKAITNAKAAFYKAKTAVTNITFHTQATLAENRGEGFVDTAVKILMAVVIGALVLAGLYLLFSGTILPELTRRIQEMFNYKG